MKYKFDDNKPYVLQQINKIITSEGQKLLIAGTEDKQLKLFDLNTNKIVKTIVGHTDSITSLMLTQRSG